MGGWTKTKHPGVRYREHKTRRHGVGNKPDRYYTVYFKIDGKMAEEAAGILAELRENHRRGEGPRTLKEKRAEHDRQQARLQVEGLTLAGFWEQDYVHHLKSRLTKKSSWEKEVAHFTKRIMPIMGDPRRAMEGLA